MHVFQIIIFQIKEILLKNIYYHIYKYLNKKKSSSGEFYSGILLPPILVYMTFGFRVRNGKHGLK
jgi:hypothetical protein